MPLGALIEMNEGFALTEARHTRVTIPQPREMQYQVSLPEIFEYYSGNVTDATSPFELGISAVDLLIEVLASRPRLHRFEASADFATDGGDGLKHG